MIYELFTRNALCLIEHHEKLKVLLLENFGVTTDRRGLLLRTPGPVSFGTFICSYVETSISKTCYISRC